MESVATTSAIALLRLLPLVLQAPILLFGPAIALPIKPLDAIAIKSLPLVILVSRYITLETRLVDIAHIPLALLLTKQQPLLEVPLTRNPRVLLLPLASARPHLGELNLQLERLLGPPTLPIVRTLENVLLTPRTSSLASVTAALGVHL